MKPQTPPRCQQVIDHYPGDFANGRCRCTKNATWTVNGTPYCGFHSKRLALAGAVRVRIRHVNAD
jgi:hypothetical protein